MLICLLGVDLGTSGTKTVLFDAEGREVASQSVEYPLYQPQKGSVSYTHLTLPTKRIV